MGDLRASLYDLFGYLIPGLVGVFSGWLFLWTFFWPSAVLNLEPIGKPLLATVVLALAFIVGHVIQAVGNLFRRLDGLDLEKVFAIEYGKDTSKSKKRALPLSKEVILAVNEVLEAGYGPAFLNFSPEDRFAFIDEGRVLSGREGDREVYIYHLGFYRGMLVATALLFTGLVLRLSIGRSCVYLGGLVYCAGRPELLFAAMISALSGLVFWRRFNRFAKYRLVRAVMLWLAVYGRRREIPGEAR